METTPTRKPESEARKAYHVATCGREKVSVYRRIAPNGSKCFMVANYSTGKRRFDSYADESLAIEAATKLARQMSERQVIAAALTNEQASEYAASVQKVKPFNAGLLTAADVLAEALRIIGGFKDMDAVKTAAAQGQPLPQLDELKAAATFYHERRQKITAKRVADVVTELIAMKKARGKSPRHVRDLSSRLNVFADVFKRDIGNVTTADVQGWLDGLKLSARSVKNYRAALASLFGFAVSRGYVFKGGNPVEDTEMIYSNGDSAVEIFTPKEIATLLKHAPKDYLPLVALGAFGGLRTAEAERLEWKDIDFESGFITVAADKTKTRSRRIVPLLPNLSAWLKPYAGRTGKVWLHSERERKRAKRQMLKASRVKWKSNALRHSFCSYRLAVTHDAAKTSLEAGNSPAMIFRHYRELVKPAAALEWFGVLPEGKLASVLTNVPRIANRRQSQPARLPEVGTAAAN